MSTSPTPEPGTWETRVHPVVGEPDDYVRSVIADCEGLMAETPAVMYLAYLGLGTPAVELVRHPSAAEDRADHEETITRFGRLAKQLTYRAGKLDTELQSARTGRLIRTVLHTDGHALFHDMVRPGEEFLAVVPLVDGEEGARRVATGDQRVAKLAEGLRRRLGLPDANYGAYTNPHPGPAPEVPATGEVGEQLDAAVRPVGLHFVSYWESGRRTETSNCFDHPDLARPDVDITPAGRLTFHLGFARQMRTHAMELKQSCGSALQGRLNRVVLDVEEGAVYYVRLPAQRYLTAVTLVQPMVDLADQTVNRLANVLRDRSSAR